MIEMRRYGALMALVSATMLLPAVGTERRFYPTHNKPEKEVMAVKGGLSSSLFFLKSFIAAHNFRILETIRREIGSKVQYELINL